MFANISKMIKLMRDGRGQLVLMALYNYIPLWLFRYINFYVGYSGRAGEDIELKLLHRLQRRFVFRHATVEDLPLIQTLFPGKNIDNLRRRFERNDDCFIALEGEKCIGMAWLGTSRLNKENKVNCTFRIEENCVWVYDAFVTREYRSKGVYLALGKYATTSSNYDKYYGFMVGMNAASLKTHKRLGAIIVYKMRFISFFGVSFYRYENMLDKSKPVKAIWSGVFGKPVIIDMEQDTPAVQKAKQTAMV